jgi:hypothetical protein
MDLCNKYPLSFFYDGGNKGLEKQIVNSLGVVTVNSNGGLESLNAGPIINTFIATVCHFQEMIQVFVH